MAVAYLQKETGEGDSVGPFGVQATETFVVKLSYLDEDPVPSVALQRPIGTPHPNPRKTAAKVTEYVESIKTGPLSWEVVVVYRTDENVIGSWEGWLVSSRTEPKTFKLVRDYKVDKFHRPIAGIGKEIGPHYYRPVRPEETATHRYRSLAE